MSSQPSALELGLTVAGALAGAALYKVLFDKTTYTEEQAAEKALEKDRTGVTVLLTNKGHLYESDNNQHAEEVMMSENKPSDVTTIWIKNAPCGQCSVKLIEFYKNTDRKPTIYVGKIWRPNCSSDNQGLVRLLLNGFCLQVWKKFHQLKYGYEDESVEDYLDEIREMAEEERERIHMERPHQRNDEGCSIM